MKRIALITAIIAVLLLIDGAYLQVSNNEVGGDSGVRLGQQQCLGCRRLRRAGRHADARHALHGRWSVAGPPRA